MKRRIKSKHKHHEEVIRRKIEEEIFQDRNIFFEKKLKEATEKYRKRINYLVGANNELMRELTDYEQELTHKDYISVPNKVADCIVLDENF